MMFFSYTVFLYFFFVSQILPIIMVSDPRVTIPLRGCFIRHRSFHSILHRAPRRSGHPDPGSKVLKNWCVGSRCAAAVYRGANTKNLNIWPTVRRRCCLTFRARWRFPSRSVSCLLNRKPALRAQTIVSRWNPYIVACTVGGRLCKTLCGIFILHSPSGWQNCLDGARAIKFLKLLLQFQRAWITLNLCSCVDRRVDWIFENSTPIWSGGG